MRRIVVLLLALVLLLPATAIAGPNDNTSSQDQLRAYTATVSQRKAISLREAGYDISAIRPGRGRNVEVEIIASGLERAKLAADGVELEAGATRQALAEFEAQSEGVYRKYSGDGGIAQEYRRITRQYPGLTKLMTIGRTVQGQRIYALKLTAGARGVSDGARPAVLYLAAQHAREWITPELNRRLLHYLLENRNSRRIRRLLATTELWFVPVANPDGYDYTFT
ncbi:MAG: M14 family zinc carboxypeptidase, partial [Egibacteraceae bacterium]